MKKIRVHRQTSPLKFYSCFGNFRVLTAAVILALLLGAVRLQAQDAATPPAPMIPDLNWVPRSDWLNVKTASPAAVGDGVTDDTAALQAALNTVREGSTIYLPPGKYRITKTLEFNRPRPAGVTLIGHGRSTIITWDGDANGRMLWVHGGAVYSRYVGLTWEGNNKAAVGIDHAAKTFETEVTHQHEAFLDFLDSGIRIGYVDPAAKTKEERFETAEVEYDNCLFQNCRTGVAILQFNDYDNTFDGCEFQKCGTGIKDTFGNVYARDTHFEQSSVTDISLQCEHPSSVRRCTSSGSNRFIEWLNFPPTLTIQDCHVAGWKAGAAIVLNGGPVMMLDCTFSHPDGDGVPVQLANPMQRLVLAGNTFDRGSLFAGENNQDHVVKLPEGKKSGVISSATQSFLKSDVPMPGKIFDAKGDYGAKGDGITDDTDAIQKTIDAARNQGQGAVAYLPTGSYIVKETLNVTGSNYSVEGSGFRSGLIWRGDDTGTIMNVVDPDHLTLANINVGSHDLGQMQTSMDIHQTSSTGTNSFMTYDHVDVFGMYQKKADSRGLVFTGLSAGSTVHIRHVQGNMRFVDSAQATILADTSYEGAITVSGKSTERDGFLGFQMRLSTVSAGGLFIRDNQNIVMTDYYVEQADNGCFFQGGDDDPDGHIVIQGAKMQTVAGPMTIDNYGGTILLGPDQYYLTPKPVVFSISGTRSLNLILAANSFFNTYPDMQNGNESAQIAYVGNDETGTPPPDSQKAPIDHLSPDMADKANSMLDELRRMGELDLQLNYPAITPAAAPNP